MLRKVDAKSKLVYWCGIVLILETGLLHILTAQGEYEDAAYMGYLFAANFFGSLLAAYGIYHKQFWGWMLGLVIVTGSITGYIWSRTFGMPGMNVEEWFSPFGIVSMLVEGVFILITLMRPWKNPPIFMQPLNSPKLRYAPHVVALLVINLMGILTYQWNLSVIQAFGHHVGSLEQVCSNPITTFTELEEKYGIQISLVAISMMDGVVDVRIKIVDSEKASLILQNQAALLVNQEALILAPHMHSHHNTRLKVGKIFVMFFPTDKRIHVGSEVSLVFGPVRIEPVTVK